MALPTPLTDAWIKGTYPGLEVTIVSRHELQVTNPNAAAFIMRLRLPFEDFEAEASVLWPGAKQHFRARGGGRAEETYKWVEEALSWNVSWDVWVDGWLKALSAAGPTPVRPGK